MQSELKKVSEALRDELASGAFTKDFDPGETFTPGRLLEDLDTLHVDVVPVRSDPKRRDRGHINWLNTVAVGVRYRFDLEHQDDATGEVLNRHVHGLLLLGQELITFCFQRERLVTYPQAALVQDPEVRLSWSESDLDTKRQFTSIFRVAYESSTEINP